MDDPYNGEVSLNMAGENYTLVYDWAALAKLKTTFTESDLDAIVNGENMEMMAEVMAIGLQRHHEGIAAEEIKKLSPPLLPTVTALNKALTYAYFGPDGDTATKTPQKKTRKKK